MNTQNLLKVVESSEKVPRNKATDRGLVPDDPTPRVALHKAGQRNKYVGIAMYQNQCSVAYCTIATMRLAAGIVCARKGRGLIWTSLVHVARGRSILKEPWTSYEPLMTSISIYSIRAG